MSRLERRCKGLELRTRGAGRGGRLRGARHLELGKDALRAQRARDA